jgi:hypothetical protein
MSKQYSEEEIQSIVDGLEIKTGVGDPSNPYFGQLLSAEDEKRIDEKGRPIVEGKPWSGASTGLWLTVACAPTMGGAEHAGSPLGGDWLPVSLGLSTYGLKLGVHTTLGRPKFSGTVAGSCMELPSDLASDSIKRKYVVEWLKETCAEALALYGCDVTSKRSAYSDLGLSVATVAEDAILKAGL